MFTVPKKLSLRLPSGCLSPGVGTPWVSQLGADHIHILLCIPCLCSGSSQRCGGVLSWLSLAHGSAHQLLPKAADGGQGTHTMASPGEQHLFMDDHRSITEGVG